MKDLKSFTKCQPKAALSYNKINFSQCENTCRTVTKLKLLTINKNTNTTKVLQKPNYNEIIMKTAFPKRTSFTLFMNTSPKEEIEKVLINL